MDLAHRQRTGPHASGRIGSAGQARLRTMAPGTPALDTPLAGLVGTGVRAWSDGTGASWSARPLPERLHGSAESHARRHDAVSVSVRHGSAELHAGISGATPVYLDEAGEGICFSTQLDPLLRTRTAIEPDWDGVAQLLTAGAPLGGRTTVRGVRRLQPWESVRLGGPLGGPLDRLGERGPGGRWPWLEVEGTAGSVGEVTEALLAQVSELAEHGRLAPLLSGGWDSRILAALAARTSAGDELVVRTTSSDTGTVLEELVAAQVAQRLGARHKILMPRRDWFEADLVQFARAVDFQTAFHIWLVPVQRDLDPSDGTVLDGLGGGLVVGGAFADPAGPAASLLDRRFEVLTPYLRAAPEVLAPDVIGVLTDRTRAGFEAVAAPLVGHRFGATFTAYLTRTVPGISLAPYGLLTASTAVATPFLDDRVVTAAMSLPPTAHTDGHLYAQILHHIDADLAALPTAAALTPWPRPHPRRITSLEAARVIRDLVLAEPVRRLVSDELARADLTRWVALLSRRGPQHLLRGLAVLSLWFETYRSQLGSADVGGLLR